jgi:tripeptide aminopeptidase
MNKKKLIEVLEIQSESYNQEDMYKYITSQLDKIDCAYYDFNGCIYVTKGGNTENFPCVVSHMDTVHDIVENLTAIEVNGNITGFNGITMEQTGIGGDDKVGIFITLQCLNSFDNIKAVFFRDEEIGCIGSYTPDMKFFDNCGFVLQCDRKGNSDFVINASGTELSCKPFRKDIKKILRFHNYKTCNGMMTDVMALKESGIQCSMANVSCGYYNPHSHTEYVNIVDVTNCLLMVKDIIRSLQGNKYICTYNKPVYQYQAYKNDPYFDYSVKGKAKVISAKSRYYGDLDDEYWNGEWSAKPVIDYCDCCYEEAKVKYSGEYNQNLCDKCTEQYCTKPYNGHKIK